MTKWSSLLGMELGAVYGTFLIPLIGTIIGAFLGTFVGLITGIVCGVVIGIITCYRFYPLTNPIQYQRTLALSSAVIAFIVVYLGFAVLLPTNTFEKVAPLSVIAAGGASYLAHGFAKRYGAQKHGTSTV